MPETIKLDLSKGQASYLLSDSPAQHRISKTCYEWIESLQEDRRRLHLILANDVIDGVVDRSTLDGFLVGYAMEPQDGT